MSTDGTGSTPLDDKVLEDQIRLGERSMEALAKGNQRTLDTMLDAQDATFLSMNALALDDLARDLLRKDPI